MNPRLAAAFDLIDAANGEDPTSVAVGDQAPRPQALVQGELASEWVGRLDSDASDAQLVAARAHHLRRWASPRADYPEGRAGYLRWRTAAKRRHAEELATILRAAGYDETVVTRAQQLVRKERLASDPEVQTHEDALCLVFLQTQLEPVLDDLGDERTGAVLVKTAAKMSPAGLAAVGDLALSARSEALLRSYLPGGA